MEQDKSGETKIKLRIGPQKVQIAKKKKRAKPKKKDDLVVKFSNIDKKRGGKSRAQVKIQRELPLNTIEEQMFQDLTQFNRSTLFTTAMKGDFL